MIYKPSFVYFVFIGLLNLLIVLGLVQGENYELLRPPYCGYSNVSQPKVVGGVPSRPGEWPWMAVLGYESETNPLTWRCGGSLITSRHVLTAAHCVAFTTPNLRYVRLGDVDLTSPGNGTNAITVTVEKKIQHPCYKPYGKYMNDVAVVRLSEDLTFTDTIRPICLPLDNSFQKHNYVGSLSHVVGCGRTTLDGPMSPILRQIEVPVLENRVCENAYRYDPRTVIDNRVICAGCILGGKDACQGDSGGPLILRINRIHYGIGLVSHGRGCAFIGSPGVYTRVTAFLGFITSALNQKDYKIVYPKIQSCYYFNKVMVFKVYFKYLALIGLFNLLILSISVQGTTYELLRPPQCGYSKVRHPKIVGGEPARLDEWPWMAAIGFENATHPLEWLCGGSLITSRHVLTAAHCAIHGHLKYVRLGELDLTSNTEGANPVTVTVERKTVHPDYIPDGRVNDVAVLRLSEDIKFTDEIHPVCLPIDEPLVSSDFVGTHPFVAGWGAKRQKGTGSPILREVEVEVFNNDVCQKTYGRLKRPVIDNRVICAGDENGGKDSCQGDSGGPLMVPVNTTYYEIGIVSYGYGCARRGFPGIYSRVTAFLPFIRSSLT